MEYKRASEIFPVELLEIIQAYAEGCVVYIPKRSGERQDWGKSTGIKQELKDRNHKIKKDHQSGLSVHHLTDKYHLTESMIKKIIYGT